MKVIIAGSRDIDADWRTVEQAVYNTDWVITEVVSGAARGIDTYGEQWAVIHKIPIKRFPADWDNYGKRAGHMRNYDMAKYADALIAVWDGKSKGTLNMINNMVSADKPVYVYCPT